MAYIGRGVDNISNVEKLDNITFSGSTATFNLTKGGSAFTPSSAECIRLAIDGIEQGNNYTVSGSQITFDFTPSGSSTNNWIYHIGVGVITTPGDGTVTEAKIGSSAVTTAKINDGAVTSGKIASGVIPSTRPNVNPIIINGDMNVAQRGTSSTGVSTSSYQTCDRMQIVLANLGAYTIIQEDLSSGNAYNNGFKHAWRIDTTTADASPGSADLAIFRYKFEGQDVQVFKKGTSNAETYTLAFWVKSNKTGVGQVNLSDTDNTRMCSATYTISSADTWEHKVLNYAADTTGAFDNDNAVSLQIDWFLDSGSNFEGGSAPTAWETQSNGDRNASGNLNIGDNTANDWSITGIQLEVGEYTSSTLPPFQHESFGDNLARCQRYFFKIEDTNEAIGGAFAKSSSQIIGTLQYPVVMRGAPSATNNSLAIRIDGSGELQTSSSGTFTIESPNDNKTIFKMTGFSIGNTDHSFVAKRDSGSVEFSSEL